MKDDSSVFSAFLACPYKASLEIRGEPGQENALETSNQRRILGYREATTQRHSNDVKGAGSSSHIKWIGFARTSQDGQLASGPPDTTSEFLAEFAQSVRAKKSPQNGTVHVPLLLVPTEKISNQQKLVLAFAGNALSKAGHTVASYGKIIHGDGGTATKVPMRKLYREIEKVLATIQRIRDGSYSPPLILNPHCKVCKFSNYCRPKAIEKDDLSLIPGLSQKEILKLNKKGIFSVTQLSHTYRPRRRRPKTKGVDKHSHALKALAIRDKKIYVTQTDKPSLGRVLVFFDVEGIPDRDFYYLIGVKVTDGTTERTFSFWADDKSGEEPMWKGFLTMLSAFDSFSLLHFGGYDSEFVSRMLKRYGTVPEIAADRLRSALINVLTYCYLNIYFPTYSNSLKELATYLNFQWSSPGSSGLDSIDWRHQWEASKDDALKQKLLQYNLDDCGALTLLTNAVLEILENGRSRNESVIPTDDMKVETWRKWGTTSFALPEFDYINKCAYFDYQRTRIFLRTDKNIKKSLVRKEKIERRYQRPNKIVQFIKRPQNCPVCKSRTIHKSQAVSRTNIDLRFGLSGVRKWITKYVAQRFICRKCRRSFLPDDYIVAFCRNIKNPALLDDCKPMTQSPSPQDKRWHKQKYGHSLLAWVLYQYIGQCQSSKNILKGLNDIFGFGFRTDERGLINYFKSLAADYYHDAYLEILKNVRSGHLIHADETRVNGSIGYVWVFTNLQEVVYIYSDSREGQIIRDVLKDFKGILVSDFYSAYDSVPCEQQRCLIHLIRDFNDDLLANPFDTEFKRLVVGFGQLLKMIVETIDAHGLKAYFLNKHKKEVEKYYESIVETECSSEVTKKYQTRLRRNKDRLFTFLNHNGVPWNNNNAENAIKAFAKIRNVIGGQSAGDGLKDTLMMLSIAQTLKNKNISFLDFLKSGERSLSKYLSRVR